MDENFNSDSESKIKDSHTLTPETETPEDETSWLTKFWNWKYTSPSLIKNAEDQLLSYLESPYKQKYVNIGPLFSSENEEDCDCNIWTLSMNEESNETPLILLHGLASGIALWALNLDHLAKDRPVYCLDLPGFGRSSRPQFKTEDPEIVESQFVNTIEQWREKMNLDKIILLAHSFGGFIAYSYSIKWPDRVAHLILADPWGFSEFQNLDHVPFHVRIIVSIVEPLNPLWAVRFLGPFGKNLIQFIRSDLIGQFNKYIENATEKVGNYIYHCNCQNPTGETAFHSLMKNFGWAKNPMIKRIQLLNPNIPLTLIYGKNSWVRHLNFDVFKELRLNTFVDGFILEDAGHHVYADQAKIFNKLVSHQIKKVETNNNELECFYTPQTSDDSITS